MTENEKFNLKIVFKFNKNDEILIEKSDDCNLIINDITQIPKIKIIKNLSLILQINKIVFNFVVKKFMVKFNFKEFEKNTNEDEKFCENNNINLILNSSNLLMNINKNNLKNKVKNNKKFIIEKEIVNEDAKNNENNKKLLLINDKK